MEIPAWTQLPFLVLLVWLFTSIVTTSFPTLRGKRICLLIAHPDDEAMFFGPTLISLANPALNNKIFILCLSSGDADGLGHVRKGELVKSALKLGVTSAEHVVVVEDKRFVDSMTTKWKENDISDVLTHYFAPNNSRASKTAPPTAGIDVIITFDQGGVSGHPNHISLFYGSKAFVASLLKGRAGWDSPVKLYSLSSTHIVRKYSSVLDCVGTIVYALVQRKEKGEYPTPLLAVSGPAGFRKAQVAMTSAHQSQMKWFRWGWIGISRYMVINDLQRIRT